MFRRSIVAIVVAALMSACSSTGGTVTPVPTATPAPPTVQHLYVGNDNSPGTIAQYTLPITAASTANFSIVSNNVVSMGLDAAGDMAVGDNAGHLAFFTAPLSAASTPASTFANGSALNDGQTTFTAAGDLLVGNTTNGVNEFTHPLSNATVPSASITNAALVSAIGTAVDSSQTLYVANAGSGTAVTCISGAGTCSDLFAYASPYTGAPVVTSNAPNAAYRKIALTSTQLFAASVAGTGRVDVYALPLTASSAPAFAITNGVNAPEAVAVDPQGNLYVGNLGNSTITVYAAPVSAASVPSVTLTVGTFAIFGIAIGK